jgi:signal transduction protein with GAF and PtsI domain
MGKPDQATCDSYIKALTDINRAITSDLLLEDLLKRIVRITAKVTGVKICSLWLIDENEKPPKIRLKASQFIDPEYARDRSLNVDEGVVGVVVTNKRPISIKNVLRSRRFKAKEMARKLGLVSVIGVPLQGKDEKIIGVLNCFTTTSHTFSKTETSLLTAVASQTAVAIINAELIDKARAIEEVLATRKFIERAKEILVRRRNLDANSAFRWIQKRSMDSRKSMREVAEAILLSEDLGYYSSIPHALKKEDT